MDKDKKLTKSFISPPGDTLKEHLDFIGMQPAELAQKMNVSEEKLQGLISGREPVSAEIASKLESVLDITAAFWLNREKQYRQELNDCGVRG